MITITSKVAPIVCDRCDGWGYKKGTDEEPTLGWRKKKEGKVEKTVPYVKHPGSGCVKCRGRGTLDGNSGAKQAVS